MANEPAFTVFQDKGQHQKDHAAFRRWQSDNPRGYLLNFRVGKPPMLHRSLCPHIENFSDPGASLTGTAKFCSTTWRNSKGQLPCGDAIPFGRTIRLSGARLKDRPERPENMDMVTVCPTCVRPPRPLHAARRRRSTRRRARRKGVCSSTGREAVPTSRSPPRRRETPPRQVPCPPSL
jgi:hypothetical protein